MGENPFSLKSLVISDGVACFRSIEEVNSSHHPIVTEGGSDYVELSYFNLVKALISNVKNAMHGTYHSIRKKLPPLPS